MPEAGIVWLPRANLAQFFVQYYMYARGDAQAQLWPRRHALRYATYFALVAPSEEFAVGASSCRSALSPWPHASGYTSDA